MRVNMYLKRTKTGDGGEIQLKRQANLVAFFTKHGVEIESQYM